MTLPHCRSGDWSIGSYNLGLEVSTVRLDGQPYLLRLIVYVRNRTLRLHKFYRGDDDRAFHDHPWPFWTFPLCAGYVEKVPGVAKRWRFEWVRGWRLHRRPSSYQHIVVVGAKMPFWTIVVTGRKDRGWGFWPDPWRFVPYREWK